MLSHLGLVPAVADAEDEAAAGQVVERRHLLGEDDRVALSHKADARAEADRRRGARRLGQRAERLEQTRSPWGCRRRVGCTQLRAGCALIRENSDVYRGALGVGGGADGRGRDPSGR